MIVGASIGANLALHYLSLCVCRKKQIKIFEEGGHGTAIFETHPEGREELLQWLD